GKPSMTLPANIRVNVGAPFPAVVKGTAGIAIQKANGIWTLGLGYPQLGIQNAPTLLHLSSNYVALYDSIAKTYFLVSMSAVSFGGVRNQRSVTSAPVTIDSSDQILHLNVPVPPGGPAGFIIVLPSFATRAGVPLTFKDVGMQATANPITIAAATGEAIDGFP